MIRLYEHPLSPYAQKVKIALYEKNLPFEATTPDLFGLDEAWAATSPRLEVPSLVDGDVSIFDSTIILEYLEDRTPQPALLPPTPAERARVRMIEEICDSYYEAINWGLGEIRFFKRATGPLRKEIEERAGRQIAAIHGRLERELGGREWMNGERFGWGDLSVVPYVAASATWFGFAPPAGSRLAAWLERAAARESVRRTLDASDALIPAFDKVSALVASGSWKREYRDHRLEWMLRSGGTDVVLEGMARGNIRFSIELD
jgi:glutathione S-transferase/RNA polymerase-associated protein